jgi:enamine deaminase RidA (YjgF/YER057c/UK114 family)
MKRYNPAVNAPPNGPYSHGVEVPAGVRWLHTAGQVGTARDGTAPPDIEGQTEQAWRNLLAVLEEGGMGVGDIVKIHTYLTRAEDIPAYGKVRARFLGDARPASTLVVVQALARPGWLVEVEAVAAKA